MNKKLSITAVTITFLLLLIGGSSGALALPNPAISNQQTTRFYVWASAGPLSYLTDARITIRDAKGKLVAIGKTNHRGMVGFRLRNRKLRELPLDIASSGGKVNGVKFRTQLKAQAQEVGGKVPIIHLDLISTTARQITGPRMNYQEATAAVRNTLKINRRATVDILRVKNPYVDGDRLNHTIVLAGGHNRFMKRLGRLARLGETMNGLEPPKPTIKRRGQSPAARILEAALQTDQAPQALEPVATTQSNSSTLCTTATPGNGNTVANYGSIATASLLEVAGVPLSASDGVTGMLLSSVGYDDTSPTTEALDNIAEELDCISTQLNAIKAELNEIETMINYATLQTELTNANHCETQLNTGWGYYNALVNGSDGAINSSNPNLCLYNGGAGSPCGSGDIYEWQAEVNYCGTVINDTLFGTGGDAGGSAWAQLNLLYQSEYAWYTQAQTQAMQSFLSYWSTIIYYQFVLQNEVYNFYGQFANAVTFGGGPGTYGSTACAYNQSIPNVTVCQWQSNIQYAFPPDLYSDEIGLWNGTAVNAFPGGLAIGSVGGTGATPLTLDDSYLSSLYTDTDVATSGTGATINYDASTVTAGAQTAFNGQGINPAGNASAIETYESPQAMRTLTLTSSDVSALGSPQTSGGLTASTFFYNAVNQVEDTWPTSDGLSASNIGYYTSDNVSIINGSTSYYPTTASTTVAMNSTIPSGTPTTKFNCYPCTRTSGDETILAALMGRTWWPGANNATNQAFYTLLPPPLTVPNAPNLISLTPGTSEIQVAFNPVPESEDGGMAITNYVAACTTAASVTTTTYGPSITATGMSSPISVGGLLTATEYYCTIQAQNAGGLSYLQPITNCAKPDISCPKATTTSLTTPSAPLGLTANVGNQQISLAFSPPDDTGGQPITGYIANCTSSTAGTTSGQVTGTGSPLVITGLTGSALYTCSVAAQNALGTGQAAYVTATPLASTTPGAPTLVSVSMVEGSTEPAADLVLNYVPSADLGGSPLARFDATCVSTDATPTITFGGWAYAPAPQIKAYGPSGSYGYTYSCTVTATNQDGYTSPPSNAVIVAP